MQTNSIKPKIACQLLIRFVLWSLKIAGNEPKDSSKWSAINSWVNWNTRLVTKLKKHSQVLSFLLISVLAVALALPSPVPVPVPGSIDKEEAPEEKTDVLKEDDQDLKTAESGYYGYYPYSSYPSYYYSSVYHASPFYYYRPPYWW